MPTIRLFRRWTPGGTGRHRAGPGGRGRWRRWRFPLPSNRWQCRHPLIIQLRVTRQILYTISIAGKKIKRKILNTLIHTHTHTHTHTHLHTGVLGPQNRSAAIGISRRVSAVFKRNESDISHRFFYFLYYIYIFFFYIGRKAKSRCALPPRPRLSR